MTRDTMLADCYRRLRYQTSPDAIVVTRLTAFLNETQQELADDPRLSSLLRGSMTFSSVANQAEYGLPPNIGRITKIRDTSNRWPLDPVSLSYYRWAIPNQSVQTGTPRAYCLLGPKPVTKQPAAATGVWAASTAAGDTTQNVSFEAIRTGGYLHQPTATALTGTARVQIGTLTDYIEIYDWYLSAVPAGDVSLYDAAVSGNVLGVIPRGQTRSTSQFIGLLPTPSAVLSYTLDYEHALSDFQTGVDEPLWLPPQFHRLLPIGARRKEWDFLDDDRVQKAEQEWVVVFQQLLGYVNNPPDQILVPGGQARRGSDLGAWYPAGTIWD